MLDLSKEVSLLATRIHQMREAGAQRLIIAIAGPPASGKSSLAEALAHRLRLQKCPSVVVSMDGFHLDNKVLEERGLRGRKGAPETFDAGGFLYLVARLHEGEEVVAPLFDRTRDIAISGALVVPANCPVVIVEGNYLLFDEAPWRELADSWDFSAWIDVPQSEIRSRLIQRWLDHGLSRAAATRRVESNDLINARRVALAAMAADEVVSPHQG